MVSSKFTTGRFAQFNVGLKSLRHQPRNLPRPSACCAIFRLTGLWRHGQRAGTAKGRSHCRTIKSRLSGSDPVLSESEKAVPDGKDLDHWLCADAQFVAATERQASPSRTAKD
jgi:hypothetical protein